MAEEPLILFHADSISRKIVDERFAEVGVSPRVVMELRSPEAMRKLVEVGVGISFLPSLTVQESLESGSLKEIDVKDVSFSREIGVAWTEFAESALPAKVAPLAKTKSLLRRRDAAWRAKGAKSTKGQRAFRAATDELVKTEREQLKKFAIPRVALVDLLHGLSGRVEDLHARETTAIERLATAIG